jgi:hypothetical protein
MNFRLLNLLAIVLALACQGHDAIVEIHLPPATNAAFAESANALVEARFEILAKTDQGYRIRVRDEDRGLLHRMGYQVDETGGPRAAPPRTLAEIDAQLDEWALDFADIARVYEIGRTEVAQRPIRVIQISDNVSQEEAEPEFKYVANIHGDETSSMEMSMRLAELLLTSYGSDPLLTALVDETDIHIMPVMNPDGYVNRRRANDNGFDLNRNFPAPGNPNPPTLQHETQLVMDWTAANHFVLSGGLHSGAIGMIYPWGHPHDFTDPDEQFPETELARHLSFAYTDRNATMAAIHGFHFGGGDWIRGVINGADWFAIYGEMADWNYRYHGCIETTLEFTLPKTPSTAAEYDQAWADNRDAMVDYMRRVHGGVRGHVRCAETGLPLTARVHVGLAPQATVAFQLPKLTAGWQLLSLPVEPLDRAISSVFPNANSAWCWDARKRQFLAVSQIQSGVGYWVDFPEAPGAISVIGTLAAELLPQALKAGWNLLGSRGNAPLPQAGFTQTQTLEFARIEGPAPATRGFWMHTPRDTSHTLGLLPGVNPPNPILSDGANGLGDYFRLLLPGRYSMWFEDATPPSITHFPMTASLADLPIPIFADYALPHFPLQICDLDVPEGVDAQGLPRHLSCDVVMQPSAEPRVTWRVLPDGALQVAESLTIPGQPGGSQIGYTIELVDLVSGAVVASDGEHVMSIDADRSRPQ